MSILIFALILILIVGLAIYLVDLFPMDARLGMIAKAVIVILFAIILFNRAGLV